MADIYKPAENVLLELNQIRLDLEAIYQYHELGQDTRWGLQQILRRLTRVATDVQCKLAPIKGEGT